MDTAEWWGSLPRIKRDLCLYGEKKKGAKGKTFGRPLILRLMEWTPTELYCWCRSMVFVFSMVDRSAGMLTEAGKPQENDNLLSSSLFLYLLSVSSVGLYDCLIECVRSSLLTRSGLDISGKDIFEHSQQRHLDCVKEVYRKPTINIPGLAWKSLYRVRIANRVELIVTFQPQQSKRGGLLLMS
ncbi:hypothetical protein OUZ56_022107 [Daphnia magna]|uniref:Uncharacterized protein n=1 Tax=Daphnia magna TaxID=35525 RepID=A0ABR0AVD7_9CRUS|nr:hypothetical protein OUZ56_022107 [Daphnia magna]